MGTSNKTALLLLLPSSWPVPSCLLLATWLMNLEAAPSL
jgi:hypothetical protein